MKLSENGLRELYQVMTARKAAADCPGEDALIRAASGDVDPKVVEHMARCSDCAREYQIARTLQPLQSEMQTGHRAPQNWMAVAATAVIVIAGAIGMLMLEQQNRRTISRLEARISEQQRELATVRQRDSVQLRSTIAELSRPQFGAPIVDVDADVTRGEPRSLATVTVSPTADVFTLILHLPSDMNGALDLDIDGTGEQHVTASSGSITLTLHRQTISAGMHKIRVRSGARQVEFRFHLNYT